MRIVKIITDLKEANNLLKLYTGASFQIYMYSVSLKRIALRLMLPKFNEIIYIVGIGCESINSRFNFINANLFITTKVEKMTNEKITTIIDEGSGFKLITSGGFSLAYGKESDFGTSFDNFLLDKF